MQVAQGHLNANGKLWTETIRRVALTGSAVGVGIPGLLMEYQGAFRGKQSDKPGNFTVGRGKRMGTDRYR